MFARVYDGRSFAHPTQTLGQVRKKKGSGKDLSVAKNMKVGNLEDKFDEEFGLKVQVAGSDDSYLCKDEFTLNAAQQEDEKKLARKERKAARQAEASDDGDGGDNNDLDYYSHYIISWKLCTTMKTSDITETLDLALQASGCDQAHVVHKPRLLSDNGSGYVPGELTEWLGDKKM